MKHLKTIEEFKTINEQLFGNMYGEILNLLGIESDFQEAGESPISGEIKYNISGDKQKNIKALMDAMKRHNITNPYTQIAILSCIGKETGFVPQHEHSYSKTPNSRLRKLFGNRLKDLSDSELDKLKKDDIKFFDRIYGIDDPTGKGKQYGNTKPGDGWKYTTGGFNGLTFKSNYEAMQKLLETKGKLNKTVNIVNNPELLINDIDVAAEIAILYFLAYAPSIFSKYGIKDINDFKDQKTALKAMVYINAGPGKNPAEIEKMEGYKKATEIAQNFKIEDLNKSIA